MNRRSRIAKIVAVVLGTAVAAGCAVAVFVELHAQGSDIEPPARAPAASDATQPAPGQSASADAPATADRIYFPGTIEAIEMTDVYSKASGYVSGVNADIGDHVKKGQVLAIVDDPELADDRGEAQATLEAKKQLLAASDAAVVQAQQTREVARRSLTSFQATLKLAEVTLARQEQLFEGKAATGQQLDEVKANAEVARDNADVATAKIASADADLASARAARAVAAAQVDVATAQVRKIDTLLQYLHVVAPFDAVVTRRLVNRGDLVQNGTTSRTTPLFTCQRIDVVRVFCQVPESAAAGVAPDQAAQIKLFGLGGETLNAGVTRMSSALNPLTRTMRIEIDLPNPVERLRPGMYVQVSLTPRLPATRPNVNPPVSSATSRP